MVVDVLQALLLVAERQHGLITRAQALAKGLGAGAIRGRLTSGAWERVHAAVYRVAGSGRTWKQSLMAACLAAGRGSAVSHHAAARLWKLPSGRELVEITITKTRCIRLAGVTVHRVSQLPSIDIVWLDHIPVTSAARTVIDLAGVLTRKDLAEVLDHALAERTFPLAYLRKRCAALGTRGRPGSGALASLIVERVGGPRKPGSAFERRLFKILKVAGLPLPEREFEVRLPDGRLKRIDFAFVDCKLAIEADSYRHHSSLSDWSRDHERNQQLIALGWQILSITYDQMMRDPEGVADLIRRALKERRAG
jgi:very-short-patch-repair endonuclease